MGELPLWCGWQAALVLMGCYISKLFEEHNGAGYRTAADRFKAVVHFHGDPRSLRGESQAVGKDWEAVEATRPPEAL